MSSIADDLQALGQSNPIEFRGETTILVDLDSLFATLSRCKDLGYEMLLDISSLDHMGEEPRFEMVYELATLDDAKHLRIRSKVADGVDVPSAVSLWRTANWHEREVYDMMGIKFVGHPQMERILVWEGFPYFPLRKDFPLAGKESEMPEVAFSGVAPLEGGPFVTSPGSTRESGEPRARGDR